MKPLLDLRLTLHYGKVEALREARLTIDSNEIVGLVGASGSGKSSLAAAILGLHRFQGGTATGQVLFNGVDLLTLSESKLRGYRGKEISLVPQSARESLNPHLTIEDHFRQAWSAHSDVAWANQREQVLQLGESLGLGRDMQWLSRKGQSFSVGQSQRILIAMALLHQPQLLIADEPTSALDTISASDVVALLRRISHERNVSVLFISHDLLTVSDLCHRIAVMHAGEIVETAGSHQLFTRPNHAYTQALLKALPSASFRNDANALASALRNEGLGSGVTPNSWPTANNV